MSTDMSCEEHGVIRCLLEGFLENYRAFKSGKMKLEDEAKYLAISSPGPSQYCAFVEFFGYFKDMEGLVNKIADDGLFTYDFIDTEGLTADPTLDFLERLCSGDYDAKGKDVVIASGSFWAQNLKTREKIISCIGRLRVKGANMRIYAQAKEDEPYIRDISGTIKSASSFGLPKRVPISFIKAGEDLIHLEFPSSESTMFRLVMSLDLNKLDSDFKDEKTKKDVAIFFDDLIKKTVRPELAI